MKDFISIGGQQIKLTKEQISQLTGALGITAPTKALADYAVGDTVKIGGFEMVVLEQRIGETALILKGLYGNGTAFGENNCYDGSNVDKRCKEFEKKVAAIVGEENMVMNTVDLTSNDGLKCYGKIERKVHSLTADQYRKYVDVLDTVKPNAWWWLATPWSTARHDNEVYVLCVAPSGIFNIVYYDCVVRGVRPFCILKSSIFVSG